MFNWFKPKDKDTNKKAPATKSREDLIREAQSNARLAREAIGEETLARMVAALKKKEADNTSPAVQARKILEKMDKGHVADFLKTLYDEKPTKH